jgi:hypothetical protein
MTLQASDLANFRASMEQIVDSLGVPATWTQAKPPNASVSLKVGVKTISWRDEELVNAYGINARMFTMKSSDVQTLTKFDEIRIGQEKYVMDAAIPVHIGGQLAFWKGIVRGD